MTAVPYVDRRRNLHYDHPTSVKRRAEDAAKPVHDPIEVLRRKHRAEAADQGLKHKREIAAFAHSPDRLGETRQDREQALTRKHHGERRAMDERHDAEMSRMVEKEGR